MAATIALIPGNERWPTPAAAGEQQQPEFLLRGQASKRAAPERTYPERTLNRTDSEITRNKPDRWRRFRICTNFISNNKKRFLKSISKKADNALDANRYITNLSSRTLTAQQSKILALGLKYVPSKPTHPASLEEAHSQFERSNRLKYYFRNWTSQTPHPFRQKSSWMPPRASPQIEMYLDRVREQAKKLKLRAFKPNLTKPELRALTALSKDPTIVIKQADKGSGIVVEDTDRYVEDGLAHLSDHTIYRKVDSDPTVPLAAGINKFVKYMHDRGIIDNITRDYLTFKPDSMPRTQQLYFLKKIHKNPIAVRPIVSGCGGPTERISQFIDLHLQPFVPKVKSYIRDSGHLINILEKTKIPTSSILATIDVKSLYLKIPHKEGVEAVKNRLYFKNRESDTVPIPPGAMSDLLNIVLTQNYFQFNDSMYHQVQGTAMGTKMAPAYANLFMAELEEKLLRNHTTDPILWKRYIDDILCIWPGSQQSLDHFIQYLNGAHPTIKFTCESSPHSVDFLDVTIYKGDRYRSTGTLDIKPFFKPTNKFQYLEYSSAHPRNMFRGLIKGELTRLLRACSDEAEYLKIQAKTFRLFRDRGYPPKLIKSAQDSVPFSNRQQVLGDREGTPCPFETFLVVDYTPDLNVKELSKIIKPTTAEEQWVPRPCLSLRKTKDLGRTLVRAKLKGARDPPQSTQPINIKITPYFNGCSVPCRHPYCKCCRTMSRKIRITSSSNHRSYPTPKHTNCTTNCVIYLLECTKCNRRNQYVGQTSKTLQERMGGHRQALTTKTNLPLYKHFAGKPDHNFERDARVTILEKTTGDLLLTREAHWMTTLETVYPKGLNSRFEKHQTSNSACSGNTNPP